MAVENSEMKVDEVDKLLEGLQTISKAIDFITKAVQNEKIKLEKEEARKIDFRIEKYELLLILFYYNFRMGKDQIKRYFEEESVSTVGLKNVALKIIDSEEDILFFDITDCFDEKYKEVLSKLNELVINIEVKTKALREFFECIKTLKLEKNKAFTLDEDDLKRLREYADSINRIKGRMYD